MSAIEQQPAGKSSGGKIAALIGCGCFALILVGVAIFGMIFWGVTKAMKSGEPYKASIAAVQANSAAQEALGTPIEEGFMPSGSFNFNNGSGDVDFQIPVSGPNGSGTIRVVGTKSSSSAPWEYSTWQLDIEGGESIPLP